MRFFCLIFLVLSTTAFGQADPYKFLKARADQTRPQVSFNQYEDIISGGAAFVIGNIGYFTTDSTTLQIAYSGVQTVGVIGIGHGIYDYYYPHFETRMLTMLNKNKLTRKQMAADYVALLGEMQRAKRLSILWSSSLLTAQYALNAFVSKDVSQDLKDIYLFLGGVNAIVAIYSYMNVTDYEKFYLEQEKIKVGFMVIPRNVAAAPGMMISKSW
jgi:hypothetical protein